jgi:hypothetical protein
MDDERLVLSLNTTDIGKDGCFGILRNGSRAICYTLERTFPPEEKPVIPAGRFKCVRSKFIRGDYDTFEVIGVEGHDRLLFHRGNFETDSLGCILVGTKRGELSGKPAVLDSKTAFKLFWELVKGEAWFWLDVIGRD